MKKINCAVNKIVNIVTTLILILLVISVIASFQTTFLGKKYNNFFGYTLFEIKTASMSGTMEIGDWIFVKVTKDVKLNDVVTYEEDGAFVTHRIIEQYQDTFVTKGDSNTAKDSPITKERIVGKMIKVLPNFGLVKKTLFNTKVLIILVITIIAGCSLFQSDNNSNKKTKEKSKPEKKNQNNQKNIETKIYETEYEQLEKYTKEKEVKNIEKYIEEKEITNTMMLSKITVDMNSKTLSSLASKIDDTNALEVIKEETEETPKVIEPQKKVKITSKKVLLGKNKKNMIKKGLELKEEEILSMIKILLNLDILDGDNRAIANKFLGIYIENKYINQGDLKEDATITKLKEQVNENIILFGKELIKYADTNSEKNKIEKIMNMYLLVNKLDMVKSDIEKIINSTKLISNEDKKKVIKEIKKNVKSYTSKYKSYFSKMETKKFDLILKKTPIKDMYYSNISSNIQFNKLFSNYSIDKTYKDSVIVEDLRELQLKMVSLNIFKDMLEFSYKKKYLIDITEGIYNKEKKLASFLGNMDDIYSQGKIYILLDVKTLILNNKTISYLVKDGYKFICEFNYEDIKEMTNIRKILCLVDYIFITNGELTKKEKEELVPSELCDKIIYLEKSILDGPVIK